jgi:hypothetical protein
MYEYAVRVLEGLVRPDGALEPTERRQVSNGGCVYIRVIRPNGVQIPQKEVAVGPPLTLQGLRDIQLNRT